MRTAVSVLLALSASSWFAMIYLRGYLRHDWTAMICFSAWVSVPYLVALVSQYYRSSRKYGPFAPSIISGITIVVLGLILLGFHVLNTGNTIGAAALLLLYPLLLLGTGIVVYGMSHLRKPVSQATE